MTSLHELESLGILIIEVGNDNKKIVQYADFVNALVKPFPVLDDLNHMALGVAGEAGELVDCIKKHTIYGKELNRENLVEELGDLLFYMQRIMVLQEISLHEILDLNYVKLSKRYHQMQYSNEQAQQRADKVATPEGE